MSKTNSEGSQSVTALIKFFSKKEHYLAFKNGSVLFRPPHYYRLRDDIGRSDRNESCVGYWNNELGDDMPQLFKNEKPIDPKDVKSILIYPLAEPKDSWMQCWSMIGPHNCFENSLEQMLCEFGTYFVILPAENISKYAKLLTKASGLKIAHGLVKYSEDPKKRSLSVKDSRLSYQKEYRFLVGTCDKDEVQEKRIENLNLEPILLEASSLKFESPSGEIRYCSLGNQKVVVEKIS